MGYRNENHYCPGRFKEILSEKVDFALGRIWGSRKEEGISLGSDLGTGERASNKILKSKVERVFSFSITSSLFLFKMLIDYTLCMSKQPIRAGVLENFRHWLLTGWMWCLCVTGIG